MEYLILIILAIGISILDDRFGGKKKVPPPTLPQEVPRPRRRTKKMQTQERFEIPPMRGVPGQAEITVETEVLRAQELRAKWEEARRAAQQEKRARERRERLAAEQAAADLPRASAPSALLPHLTADTMKQAVVLSEILGKPRALQKFPRR